MPDPRHAGLTAWRGSRLMPFRATRGRGGLRPAQWHLGRQIMETHCADRDLTVTFIVTNTGLRTGSEIAEVYARRLVVHLGDWFDFTELMLKSNEVRRVSITADTGLLADFDTRSGSFDVKGMLFRSEAIQLVPSLQVTRFCRKKPSTLKC